MYSDEDTLAGGLPHSDIHGSTPARGSPWLFAACHVLHRLLVPRHPPNALLALETCPRLRIRSEPHPGVAMHRHHPQRSATDTPPRNKPGDTHQPPAITKNVLCDGSLSLSTHRNSPAHIQPGHVRRNPVLSPLNTSFVAGGHRRRSDMQRSAPRDAPEPDKP